MTSTKRETADARETAGERQRVLAAMSTADVAAEIARRHGVLRVTHCSCGRPAREMVDGGRYGTTGYCGAPQLPLEQCDCGQGAEQHSRNVCHIYGKGMG